MEVVYDFGQVIRGIAIDAEDSIFVANWTNKTIDKVSLNNGKVSITQSTNISSSSPYGLAINSKDEIYFANFNGEIKKMTKEGIISSIVAGNGISGFADGIGKNAKIGIVEGICFNENKIAYFCDWDNFPGHSAIRKLTPKGEVTTICGGKKGNSDGKGEKANFANPTGIVYNYPTKLFYITDYWNKSIRTMTVDGNVNTLCKYSDCLHAIAIDGEGKLYVSTENSKGEGELITINFRGEIKQMNISVKDCKGLAFNSKGDLFFTSDGKLNVIRNCTKYPPHSIFYPSYELQIQELRNKLEYMNLEAKNLMSKLANTEIQLIDTKAQLKTTTSKLANALINTEAQLESAEAQLMETEGHLMDAEAQLVDTEGQLDEFKTENQSLKTQNNSQKMKIQELEQKLEEKETKEHDAKEVLEWLNSIKLENLFPILQDLGVKDIEFLKLIEESDFEGTNIKVVEKRMFFQAIKKLK